MAYIMTVTLSVVSSVLAFIVTGLLKENRKLREQKKNNEKIKDSAIYEGVASLLRVQLIEYHDRYVAEGHIPSYVYENWSKMYKSYKELGGNGLIVGMNEDIQELPII